MGFTDIFGGTTVAAAGATFLSLALASNLALGWPTEQAVSGNVVADTIEVTASAPGFNISFSDARQVSSGYTTLFNNIGGNSFNVLDSLGGAIISVAAGTAWVVYLANNSTQAGVWRVFQLGAGLSNAVAAALAGAGLRAIGNLLNEKIISLPFSVTPVAVDSTLRAELINWTGGVGVANLVAPATIGSDWFAYIRNSGSGNFTLTPAAGQVDGAGNKVVVPGASLLLVSDGANFWSVGAGSSGGGSGAFDFVNIDASGTGTLVLAGANLNRIGYKFTGILTGDRTIQVPGTIQEYWITNATTGAFNFYVKTAAQVNPGVAVTQGDSKILASDGNNVFNAITGTVSFPIAIAQGGTNATTATTARTNLGSGAAGDAIFVATTQDIARYAVSTWPIYPGGRLTLASMSPIFDLTSPIIYYTPFTNDRTMVYDGTQLIYQEFTELSQALTDNTKSPAAAIANTNYDMFIWNDAGTLRCTRGPPWNTGGGSDTVRGAGAGSTQLMVVHGVYLNSQNITNGPAAGRGTYVGTIRTDSVPQINDTLARRHCWNAYNRVNRPMLVTESFPGFWSYGVGSGVYRQAHANVANQLDILIGIISGGYDFVHAKILAGVVTSTQASVAIGLDSTTTPSAYCTNALIADTVGSGVSEGATAFFDGYTGPGRHLLTWLEQATSSSNWYGTQAAFKTVSGISALVNM